MVGLVSPLSVPFPFPSFPFLSFPFRSSSPFFRYLLAQEATALEWSANASEATAATVDPSRALGNLETRNIKSAGRLRSCGVGACLRRLYNASREVCLSLCCALQALINHVGRLGKRMCLPRTPARLRPDLANGKLLWSSVTKCTGTSPLCSMQRRRRKCSAVVCRSFSKI